MKALVAAVLLAAPAAALETEFAVLEASGKSLVSDAYVLLADADDGALVSCAALD